MTAQMSAEILSRPEVVSDVKDLAVLAVIALHADERGDVMFTWKELSEKTRVPRSTLAKSLSRLEAAGLLERRHWRAGGTGATRYSVLGSFQSVAPTPPRPPKREAYHGSPGVGISERESGISVSRLKTTGVDDPLTAEGLHGLLVEAVESDWSGPAARSLGRAARLEAQTRLARVARSRRHFSFAEAMDDLTSRVWEVLRTETDKVQAADNPWGMVAVIVERQVSRADGHLLGSEVAWEGMDEDAVVLSHDHERGMSTVSLDDVLEDFESVHQMLIHRLIEVGVPQGLAWSGTRRMLEIATDTAVNDRITRARADGQLALLGVSEKAAGAWMGLIVGTRRGGPESSYVLRVSRGGTGVTDDESRRLRVVGRELTALRSPIH